MRRLASQLVLLAIVLVAATSAPAANHTEQGLETPPLWDPDEVTTVVLDGLLGPTVSEFHPTDPLTWGDFANALAAWGYPVATPVDPALPVTVRQLDARLVGVLGLQPAAQAIRIGARNAGLKPIPSLGTETVARLVGLRINHPAAQDNLELLPDQPATRAEAAYSLAHALNVSDWQKHQVLNAAPAFTPPVLTKWQRSVPTGVPPFGAYPYVLTGPSDKRLPTPGA